MACVISINDKISCSGQAWQEYYGAEIRCSAAEEVAHIEGGKEFLSFAQEYLDKARDALYEFGTLVIP